MTHQEMETALVNLQKQVANLAERTSNRDNEAESSISTTKSDVTNVSNTADVAEAQAMYTALMTDTLIDEEVEDVSED